MLDWEYMTSALASATPSPEAGAPGYHGITYGWLVGELIRRVTGASLTEAIRALLVEPLALDGVFLGAPAEERRRLATLIRPTFRPPTLLSRLLAWAARAVSAILGLDPALAKEALLPHGSRETYFSDRMLDAEVPAMNGVFTARSLARMYAMLAGGGQLDGKRLLSEETVRRATQVQSRGLDAVVGFPMRWRLGYHLVGTSRGILPNTSVTSATAARGRGPIRIAILSLATDVEPRGGDPVRRHADGPNGGDRHEVRGEKRSQSDVVSGASRGGSSWARAAGSASAPLDPPPELAHRADDLLGVLDLWVVAEVVPGHPLAARDLRGERVGDRHHGDGVARSPRDERR